MRRARLTDAGTRDDDPTRIVMALASSEGRIRVGSGAYRDRTGDLRLAKPALSQLS
jgi:hypothetical protein